MDSNKTSIQPTIHSTDSHGTNKVNFALLDFFGYQFAPRYKQFPKETTNLVGFKSPDAYPEKYIIKPQRQINKQRFIDQWDTCQRTIASLATKTTSQKNIVKKLSSFHRINQLQAALIDYNDLIKSIFMLDYIDSRTFRQNIQTALNRGEGYHRLRKSVAYAHDGKIQVHSRPEQQLWNECTRLICNAIIFYNTFLLSQLLEKFTDLGYHQEVAIIQKVSPIA
ncbi:MAG: TnpA family transposase, partial [Salibacteraceae bacterium]